MPARDRIQLVLMLAILLIIHDAHAKTVGKLQCSISYDLHPRQKDIACTSSFFTVRFIQNHFAFSSNVHDFELRCGSSVCTARICHCISLSPKLLFKLKKRWLIITSIPPVWRGKCGTEPLSIGFLLQSISKATMSVMLVIVLAWSEERHSTSTAKLTSFFRPALLVSQSSSEGYGW